MKTWMTIVLSGWIGTGCVIEPAHESTALEELVARHHTQDGRLPSNVPMSNASGLFTTVSSQGAIDLGNEFFQDLGTNGRRCVSCHVPNAGWSVTPGQLQAVFDATDGGALEDGFGLGAAFRTNDGANAPGADVSTLAARRAAYSMLLTRGLIRVGLAVPATAEFELVAVDDPYHFASAAELSLFRRPLPTANLKFDSTVMWDGQGSPLDAAQRDSIVQFETALATAQIYDRQARDLRDAGASGGPDAILAQPFYIGINDNLGDSRTGAPFSPDVFTIYDAWTEASGAHADARRAVARGQALFNTRPIAIAGVSGINDEAAFGKPAVLTGTCTTCHDTPNGGNHSVIAPLDIGLVDEAHRTPDMPLYTLRNKTTGEIARVTDPGRAMISGKWSHIGRFKGPMLRDLAARAPYFHNGFAADLGAVADFYDARFTIGLTAQDKADLVAFLRSL
jgi:cytochrome c peroxidase